MNFLNSVERGIVQPKLKIGKPNDKYEVEADRMAAILLAAARKGQLEGRVYKTVTNDSTNLSGLYQYDYAKVHPAYVKRLAQLR